MPSTSEILKKTSARKLMVGHERFITQLVRLLPCLEKAATASDPALALYQTPSRQWLFHIQALCRIYRKVQDKKPFKAIGETVKALEDQLGSVDYWDGWCKDAAARKEFPAIVLATIQKHKAAELVKLKQVMDRGAWLADDIKPIRSMLTELDKVEWRKPEKDRKKVAEFLAGELDEIDTEYRDGEFDFHELEEGVHEFRRQLRWISIYAQCLEGLIQVKPVAKPEKRFQPYLTDAVLKSRFNVLPAPKPGVAPIFFAAPHFYALSWLIFELGIIKDDGQKTEAMLAAANEAGWSRATAAKKRLAALVPGSTRTLDSIPESVASISNAFVVDNLVLQRLRDDIQNS